METGIVIKTWNMDYSFIIKNYLDPKLWDKTWTLFQYKNFKIDLSLLRIHTSTKKIIFNIVVSNNGCSENGEVEYSLHTDISFLIRAINNEIFRLIERLEWYDKILDLPERLILKEKRIEEQTVLEKKCREFLDENNIDNGYIRSSYTDAFIDEYAKVPNLIDEFDLAHRYVEYTDIYLIWLESLKNDNNAEFRIEKVKGANNPEKIEELEIEINECLASMETENYNTELEEYFDGNY